MIPLYGFLEGDTMGLLILADEGDTVATLIEKLQTSARVRVEPRKNLNLLHNGQMLDAQITVGQARIEALDRFDVVENTGR